MEVQEGMSKRLHWVRGHVSTYTQAAPLFGKIVGRSGIPTHLSGLASEGGIDSDYRLEVA
jgi:dUTPase